MQVDFDPAVISYRDLLEVFFDSHSAVRPSWSRQYRSAIFPVDEEQMRKAAEARRERERLTGGKVYTDIEPFTGFTPAEGYHQKYMLRSNASLMREFEAVYPDPGDLVSSTAAARVNGYLGGNGSYEQLERQRGKLGLSPGGEKLLLDLVRRGKRGR